MTEEKSHQFIHEAELAERYVAGRMTDPERTAFEDHFVTCAECQSDVRFASAVRAAIDGSGVAAGARRENGAAAARNTVGYLGVARWAAAAMAAGIAAFAILRTAPSATVAALGAVDAPPSYAGIAVRSAPGRGEAIFEAAMKEYLAGHYTAAGEGLQSALAAGEDSIPTEFFIGASFLLSGDARRAAPAFANVIAKGDSPYRDEAQLYEAKALLRLGRAADALTVLKAHTPDDPAMASRLAALSDSVGRATGR